MVMVSWVYTYLYTHQVVYIKYVKIFVCQSYLNKVVEKRRKERKTERESCWTWNGKEQGHTGTHQHFSICLSPHETTMTFTKKWLLLYFHLPNLAPISVWANSNPEPYREGDSGKPFQLNQVDTIQYRIITDMQ